MISLDPLIDLLTPKPPSFQQGWFRNVEGAAEFAQIKPEALPLPACWVVRASEKSSHAGERAENVTITLDLVIAVENARKHKARAEGDNLLLAYRRAVKDRLLGWEIGPGKRPMKYVSGRVLQYTDGDMYWADRYEFTTLITNYLPDPPAYQGIRKQGTDL